jgi:hypothetical protein
VFLIRRPVTSAAAVVLCLALVGCTGDDDPGSAEPTSSASSSGTSGPTDPVTTGPSTTDPTTQPTEDPAPTVAPSTGEPLSIPGLTMRGPRDWLSRQAVSSAAAGWVDPATASSIVAVSTLENAPTRPTTDVLAESTLATAARFTKRLPDIEVAGEPAYRVEGKEDGDYLTKIGFVHGDRSISVDVELDPKVKDREKVIASVLASIQLD